MTPDRLPIVIEMIVADTQEERQEALDRLLPLQRKDFKALFEVMSPYPVTIRLLDPPIHEFLPNEQRAGARDRRAAAPGQERPRPDRAGRGHDPDAGPGEDPRRRRRPAPPARPDAGGRGHRQEGADAAQGPRRCSRPTPCSAIAACAWASPSPRSTRCRSGRSWRPRPSARQGGHRGPPARSRCPRSVPPQELRIVKTWVDAIHDEIKARTGKPVQLQVRHHDRGGAGLYARRVPGRGVGVLLLRHQRPDPGGLLLLPRRRREQVPAALQPSPVSCRTTPSRSWTRRAWAS